MKTRIEWLICGDHIPILQMIPDNFVDMFLTSPPYDNLRDYEEYHFRFELLAHELYRTLKPGGVGVWVVGDATVNGSETLTSFKQAIYFKEEVGFNLHDTMIYQKNGASFPEQTRYYNCFEYMFIFSKETPTTINILKDRKNKWKVSWGKKSYRKKDGRLIKRNKIISSEYGARFNIWRYATGKGFSAKETIAYEHPAIFPEKLARDHILSWSNPGDVILDPMMGSGTTCKVAASLQRQYIGIDCSETYCHLARKRIQGYTQIEAFV